MDRFQLFYRDLPAGPVRGSWEEAAQDAVAAGLADWVPEYPHKALSWAGAGQASIARMTASMREARCRSTRDACARAGRRVPRPGRRGVLGPPALAVLVHAG
jgi:hypothetical protein